MTEVAGFLAVLFALLAIAAALWIAGAPHVEPREHLRIRYAEPLDGGKLYAIEDFRDAA